MTTALCFFLVFVNLHAKATGFHMGPLATRWANLAVDVAFPASVAKGDYEVGTTEDFRVHRIDRLSTWLPKCDANVVNPLAQAEHVHEVGLVLMPKWSCLPQC
jgi:hypothetical protein